MSNHFGVAAPAVDWTAATGAPAEKFAKIWGTLRPHPLGWGRGLYSNMLLSTCVIVPNSVILGQTVRA